MTEKRAHIIVEGRVQGVYFRAYALERGKELGLVGWVRNRNDGSVEAVVEGDAGAVDRMIAWFHKGSPLSAVSKVTVTPEEPSGLDRDFTIHYR